MDLGELFRNLLNPEQIIRWGGLTALFIIVFAESGLLIGFFLPGDSLLITAGLISSQGYFEIEILILLLIIAAITGDSFGYWFGRKAGPRLFKRKNSRLFSQEKLLKAKEFYEKHGAKTIIYARFIPFVRTFAPICAGIAEMNYKVFITYNIVGGIFWVVSLTLVGYFFGNIPFVKKYFEFIILGVIILSVVPIFVEYIKSRKRKIRTENT